MGGQDSIQEAVEVAMGHFFLRILCYFHLCYIQLAFHIHLSSRGWVEVLLQSLISRGLSPSKHKHEKARIHEHIIFKYSVAVDPASDLSNSADAPSLK